MDISAFSDENFEVKEWINKTFRAIDAQENKNALVNTMVKKLQLYVQQVNSALEDTSQQVLQSLPRIIRDSEMLHQEALLLQEKMKSIKEEIAKVEKDTGESMATLERIDRVKTELQVAKEALHEADNWTVLATDIEEVFETRNIEQIANKLVSMQQSLSILANAADYEDRKLQLEGLKNRLEAIASPQLVQAFTSGSVEQSRKFVYIFSAMERLPQLLKYYHKCQKGSLCQQWRCLVEVEQDQSVAEWMHSFYDTLLNNWHQQVKWCQQVVGSTTTLGEVYADVLISLDPSLNVCIDAALKQQSKPLLFLMELKTITKNFARNLQPAVTNQIKANDVAEKIMKGIYAPYIPYISKYESYEESHLLQQLATMKVSREDLMDTVQGLGQSIASAVSTANEGLKRCLQFTEGCGFCGLIKAIQTYFHSYLDQYNSALRQLDLRKGEKEDWNMFQMCLTLLQTAGELLGEVKRFDHELIQSLLDAYRKPKVSTIVEFSPLLLTAAKKEELDRLIADVQSVFGDVVTAVLSWPARQSRSVTRLIGLMVLGSRRRSPVRSCRYCHHHRTTGSEMTLLESVVTALEKLCRDVHFTTYQVIFAPVSVQLETAQSTWTSDTKSQAVTDLPDYSFAPQEYITQIGEYLMTLPQHLEPFLLRENPSLTSALRVADSEYVGVQGVEEGGFADVLLGMVAKGTCQAYTDHILAICELSPSASKQLATDIVFGDAVAADLSWPARQSRGVEYLSDSTVLGSRERSPVLSCRCGHSHRTKGYLGNVLEDLGFGLTETLQQVSTLLRLSPEAYQTQSAGCSAKLVAAVRQMRNITYN